MRHQKTTMQPTGGTFCFNNRVKAANVKAVWDRLGFFVAETLKQQKVVICG